MTTTLTDRLSILADTDFIARSNVSLIEQEALQVAHNALHGKFDDEYEAFAQWLERYAELLSKPLTKRELKFLRYADCCMEAMLTH